MFLCLGAACTGCIAGRICTCGVSASLPRRCLHGVHPVKITAIRDTSGNFASALPARGASRREKPRRGAAISLPRRCLHGVHLLPAPNVAKRRNFASALPARGASRQDTKAWTEYYLCLGAACTGCILAFAGDDQVGVSLPRRCLHGVHRQKPTNCGTPFCSIRRESVDSFSEINNKDSCADYFPALFCCQGDLHHHYRQPRTDNRPVLRCEQHRLFLFILSSHYRRLL